MCSGTSTIYPTIARSQTHRNRGNQGLTNHILIVAWLHKFYIFYTKLRLLFTTTCVLITNQIFPLYPIQACRNLAHTLQSLDSGLVCHSLPLPFASFCFLLASFPASPKPAYRPAVGKAKSLLGGGLEGLTEPYESAS